MILNPFQLALPRSVRFGWSVRSQLGPAVRELGDRAWLVVGSRTLQNSGLVDDLQDALRSAGVESAVLGGVAREPLVEDVDQTTDKLLRAGVRSGDVIVGLGGGSAIDLAKAVAAMATNRHGDTVGDFLEGVGRGLTIDHQPLPIVAIPTTAGTGAEATRNAVISSTAPRFKKSLRSPHMVPALVLLDPQLTVSCPPRVTAHSGMDAITQLIESLLSRRANAFTSALCLEGLARALPTIETVVHCPDDRSARGAMSYAAFLSGVALANSGLGLAHGVAAALGVHCDIPHGLACAVMLPAAMRFNRDIGTKELAQIGRLLDPHRHFPSDDDAADAAVQGITDLCRRLSIPATLEELGVTPSKVDTLVPASHGNSLSGNPRDVSDDELRSVLKSLCIS
ncbi:MAG: iron-containing alcohol dehydrogenase [Planctomycetaceae bacterium]|nr:iron-containing alcohol dehydrogenase [Planctomycetaceae bacterium]